MRPFVLRDEILNHLGAIFQPFIMVYKALACQLEFGWDTWSQDVFIDNANMLSRYSLSKTFDVGALKIVTKRLSCSLNDLILTLFSQALDDYSMTHKMPLAEGLQVAVACNLRTKPNSKKDFTYFNRIHSEKVTCKLLSQGVPFDKCILNSKSKMEKFKESYSKYNQWYQTIIATYLVPDIIFDLILPSAIAKNSKVALTNICGPSAPL